MHLLFHDLDTDVYPHRITSGFHGAFATGVACQQGTLTLPDTWFRPPIWDLLMLQLLKPNSLNLPCLSSTFHLEYPLVLSRTCFNNYRFISKSKVSDNWLINGEGTCLPFVIPSQLAPECLKNGGKNQRDHRKCNTRSELGFPYFHEIS